MLTALVLLLIAHTDRFFYPLLALGRIDSLLFRTGVLATQDCKALIPVADIGLKPEVAASLLVQGERCNTFLLGEFRRRLAGDRFYTGPGTRIKIDFWNGGYVELDENTDPSLIQDLSCLVVSLFRSGRIFVGKADACVESLGPRSQQFSKVVYSVMPAGPYLQITVVDGEARTLLPAVVAAPKGWRIDVNSRSVLADGRAYRVSDEAIRQSIGWTLYYRNRSAPAPELPIVRLPRPPVVLPPAPRLVR